MRNKPKPANIPSSKLREQIDEAAALKRAMTARLAELESKAAGRPITKPGAWRHDTSRWLEST